MSDPLQETFNKVSEQFIAYLPNLVAAIVLVAIGWAIGWLAKRVTIQVCRLLRFDRLLLRFRWGQEFSKADVRFAAYNFVGSIAHLVVFLVFLNSAFDVLQLTALSSLVEKSVLFVPKVLYALIILLLGWIVARWVSVSIRRNLNKEDVPRSSLIARLVQAVLLLTASAMALVEIDVSREIVIIAFAVTIVTIGVLSIILTASHRREFVSRLLEKIDDEGSKTLSQSPNVHDRQDDDAGASHREVVPDQ